MFWPNCRASSGWSLIRWGVQLIMLSIYEISYQLYTPPTQRSAWRWPCSLAETCSWTITWYNLTEYKVVYDYIIILAFQYNRDVSLARVFDCRAPHDEVQAPLKHMLIIFWILNASFAFLLYEIPHLIPKLLCVHTDWLSCTFSVHSIIKNIHPSK